MGRVSLKIFALLGACLIFFAFAFGTPNSILQTASVTNDSAAIRIPVHAVEITPGVFYLGNAIHDSEAVEGYAFVNYKKSNAKPGTECGNGTCEPGENAKKCQADCNGNSNRGSNCYGFLARDAKWKTIELYIVNASNTRGLDNNFIAGNIALDIEKWENAAGFNILGEGSQTSETLLADMEQPDNKNEVYFGSIAEPGAIAVTIVWGVFSGPPWNRKLVEWDQVFDQTDFGWSVSGEAGKMDFENIATHELGHSVGMADLYDSVCAEQTMYGYATEGETKKRTLEAGDIAGVNSLYASG